MVQHVVLLLLCYSLLLTGAVPPVPPLLPRGPLPAVVTSAAPLSLPKLVAGLTAAAGLPVACSPVCGSTGQVCAVKTQSRPWPDTPPAAVRVTVVSTLFRTDPRLAAAWLADVHGQTVVNATELLVCLVGSAYSPELVRLLGATMGGTVAGGKGGGPTQPLQKLASLRVVFFETDPGLYPSWSCAMRRVASQSAYGAFAPKSRLLIFGRLKSFRKANTRAQSPTGTPTTGERRLRCRNRCAIRCLFLSVC